MTLCKNVETIPANSRNLGMFVRFSALVVTLCVVQPTEKELNTKCVVEMVKNQTILHPGGANLGKGDSRYACQ